MKLTDLATLDKWVELEKEINRRSGLNASVFDIDGIRITNFKKWSNRLCPAVKATEKGQSYICAAAHQNLAIQAMKSKQPVVEECDAGLLKIVVPIFVNGEYIGAAGGCGLLLEEGEVDTFMVYKTTDIDESEVESLSSDIGAISREKAAAVAEFIKGEVKKIVTSFEKKR